MFMESLKSKWLINHWNNVFIKWKIHITMMKWHIRYIILCINFTTN